MCRYRVPQDYGTVGAAPRENAPGGIKDHTNDLTARPAKRAEQFAVSRIPKIYGAIIGSAGQHALCRVERDAGNPTALPGERVT
jgi:hypothetical protein